MGVCNGPDVLEVDEEAPKMLIELPTETRRTVPGYIPLVVKNLQGNEVRIKIKQSTPLRKLMDAYCTRFGPGVAGPAQCGRRPDRPGAQRHAGEPRDGGRGHRGRGVRGGG